MLLTPHRPGCIGRAWAGLDRLGGVDFATTPPSGSATCASTEDEVNADTAAEERFAAGRRGAAYDHEQVRESSSPTPAVDQTRNATGPGADDQSGTIGTGETHLVRTPEM